MEYITVLCVEYTNETPTKKAMYTHDTADLAIKGVYSNMGIYMAQDNVKRVCSIAMNSTGGIYKNECWTKSDSDEEAK